MYISCHLFCSNSHYQCIIKLEKNETAVSKFNTSHPGGYSNHRSSTPNAVTMTIFEATYLNCNLVHFFRMYPKKIMPFFPLHLKLQSGTVA
jgi:hypothetical protein